MISLENIFDIRYSKSLELINCEEDLDGIYFVSRTSANNGIVARVKKLDWLEPMPENAITVALGGSVLSCFYQNEPFYTSFHIACLYPKIVMSKTELLFYCYIIEKNKYRYNYGRQANKTLKDILVPSLNQIPNWLNKEDIHTPFIENITNTTLDLSCLNWHEFKLISFFEMYAGKYYPVGSFEEGNIPIISACETNNGAMKYTDLEPVFDRGCITIGKVGMSVFYQPLPFCASPDVTVLVPTFLMTKHIALFLKCILDLEKYRWCYGRQIRLGDCMDIKIKLPITSKGQPDWQFMEDYIKSLPYSSNL